MRRGFQLGSILVFALAIASACGSTAGQDVDGGAGGPDTGAIADASANAPDANQCTGGSLCGQPATCCPAGNECIDNTCLAECSSGVRCGTNNDVCCNTGQVCVSNACATPGDACLDSYDCQFGEFCEPTLGQCLPQPDPLTCEYVPTFDNLDVMVEWSYELEEIISIPVVADVDNDGLPEVVVNLTRQDGGSWPTGNIMILSGESGNVQLPEIPHDPASNNYGSHGRATIAVGDVSGDSVPDIIYAARETANRSLIIAIDGSGNFLWKSHDAAGADYGIQVENGAATLTNFDNDPEAEIVFGAAIIDNDGTVVWDQGMGGLGGTFGTNDNYAGGISAVADLDADTIPEIISGRHAWKVNWVPGVNPGDPPTVTLSEYWTSTAPDDGYPAVADLDNDGDPEVVLVANGKVYVLNGQSGKLFCAIDTTDAMCQANDALRTQPIDLPGMGRGGPPTISDFDADGRVEIGVAGAGSYSVYDINRPGEDVVQPVGAPVPNPGDLYVRWSNTTQDQSSNATGSSVFDFQGDTAAEVIYNDECYMRVYSGVDGSVQLELENSSATIHEYPLVVDVDADGNSEIIVVSTNIGACTAPGYTVRKGIFVYGDVNDEWVPTRRVWTQHAYHVTNSDSTGNVPPIEADNWTQTGLNNYRQNVQGDGIFNAPDLTLDLSVGLNLCSMNQLELRARVSNIGALGVPPGVVVTFYEGADSSGTNLGTATTTQPILPGGSTTVTLAIPAPTNDTDYYAEADGTSATTVPECDPTNNGDNVTQAGCIVID